MFTEPKELQELAKQQAELDIEKYRQQSKSSEPIYPLKSLLQYERDLHEHQLIVY